MHIIIREIPWYDVGPKTAGEYSKTFGSLFSLKIDPYQEIISEGVMPSL